MTQSRSREIEAYLPSAAPATAAAFGPELDRLVTESLAPASVPVSAPAPELPAGFTRQPVPPRAQVAAPPPVQTRANPAPGGLLGAILDKRRRDQELVEALQRRARGLRRISGAPIIKGPIIPKDPR